MQRFNYRQLFWSTLALGVTVLLGACGGSGAGSAEPSPTPRASTTAIASPLPSPQTTPSTLPSTIPSSSPSTAPVEKSTPNILLIISDDQGIDASAQYDLSEDVPSTPTLNALAEQGVVFDHAWATPACSTTRGTLITGQHGSRSGIDTVPDLLALDALTLPAQLKSSANYATAVIGKWHLANGAEQASTHPNDVGVDYYAGNLNNVDNYYQWDLTINGETSLESGYHSTVLADLAIDWLSKQTQPWFMWLAFNAPHSPFHLPPAGLHDRDLSGSEVDIAANKREYFLAAIEAMDSEIGRVLASMDASVRANTLIVFVGDNGSPKAILDAAAFPNKQGKSSFYEGGLRVPLTISGAGVARAGQRETAQVNTVDIPVTLLDIAGIQPVLEHGVSLEPLLLGSGQFSRQYNYAEFKSDALTGWAVRDAGYKLISLLDGSREFYDLTTDAAEQNNLIAQADQYAQKIAEFEQFASVVQANTDDGGQGDGGGSGDPIDISNAILTATKSGCADYAEHYQASALDVNNSTHFAASLVITVVGNKCIFDTNAIPNHDFNDGDFSFPNTVSVQDRQFEVTTTPTIAMQAEPLSLQRDNAIMLNGVKVDLLAAGCFGIGNGKVGCNDITTPWRYDPMFKDNGFRVDSHNAHSQADGTYHYHGSPNALFDSAIEQVSPVVGFAADGFAIYGSYFNDGTGVRKARSSYRLKSGARPSGNGQPGGNYDGSFRDDYEFIEGLGDLDECNGQELNGQYAYYITDGFPYVLGCFSGTPDNSFLKN